jgi:hypothetical protein
MASQVLSGSSNASYTNSTGQNVRIIINFMSNCTAMGWAGVTASNGTGTIIKGREIPQYPSEIIISSGQSFSATCGAYNIVVIKEDGN